MRYILFIGSKLGYESLRIFNKERCEINQVFIEKEHEHEHDKYYESSISECEMFEIPYSINFKKEDIINLINYHENTDYIITLGYRKMIPDNVLKLSKIASLGTHFSPLPKYRGFAPLNWVLINGEKETAVNLFYLDKEVDSGDIIDREVVPISEEDDINILFQKCLYSFEIILRRTIPTLEKGFISGNAQDSKDATYTCARNPEDGLVDWNWSAESIYNITRALTYPYPGAFTFINNNKLYIWSCEEYRTPKYSGRINGKVIKILKGVGVVVLCGTGAVLLKNVQLENKKIRTADQVVNSIRLTLGK